MLYKKLIFIVSLSTLLPFTLFPGEVRLTRSETAKLKDYLIKTKDEAHEKARVLQEMIDTLVKEDNLSPQDDKVLGVKNALYKQQDIMRENTELLSQLRTGKYTYSLVIAQLKSLGTEPQKVLNPTGLREKVLSGAARMHPLLITIESINPEGKEAEDLDAAYQQYKIGKKTDTRMQYVVTQLLDELLAKQREILDQEALRQGVDILQRLLDSFKEDTTLSNVLKNRVLIKGYEKLDTLRKIRGF